MLRFFTTLLLTTLGLGALGCDAGTDDAACDGSACANEDAASTPGDPAHPGGHAGSASGSSDSGTTTNPMTSSDSGTATDPGSDAGADAAAPISEIECESKSDCPNPRNLGECQKTACLDGLCAVVDDDDALPEDDGNECTEESCNGGVARHEGEASGTTCSQDDGAFCDGDGACVECVLPSQCDSDVCQDGECRPELCGNTELDPGETDLDCGGDCGGCGPDQMCDVDADCLGNECPAGTCVPNCDDGVLNHGESAIDCGEACPDALCADDIACGSDDDCESGFCNLTSSLCATPTCGDGIKNGTESAIDCGGVSNGTTCPACSTACTDNWECGDTSVCYDGHCAADVNGCTIANSMDLTNMVTASLTTPIEIGFPISGLHYAPRCIKVTMGTKIRFTTATSSFASHPLVGGLIVSATKHPASTGPFTTITNTGTSKDFLMDDCAAYPYYCNVHGPSGMNGAVIVLLP